MNNYRPEGAIISTYENREALSSLQGIEKAMQNGKIAASEETKKAAQVLVTELCSTVTNWAQEKENTGELVR